MQLEGFAYRLVPIKTPSIGRYEAGRIDLEKLYENLMTNFRWGGMNAPGVYLDDFHVRTLSIVRLRSRFFQLAEELINQGDTARAIAVLDRCLELTPHEKVPYDHNIIQIANAYYRCNQFEKGNTLVEALAGMCRDKITYYLDQDRGFVSSISDEILYNFQVLQNLSIITKNFNQTDLSNRLDSLTTAEYAVFSAKVR
jgi:hypothetical protein